MEKFRIVTARCRNRVHPAVPPLTFWILSLALLSYSPAAFSEHLEKAEKRAHPDKRCRTRLEYGSTGAFKVERSCPSPHSASAMPQKPDLASSFRPVKADSSGTGKSPSR